VPLDGTQLGAADFLARLSRLPRGCEYYIGGLPSYIARLAARLLRAGAELPAYPRVVITGGETQTTADVAAIERAFRCPVHNRYGTWELHYLAQTCPDNPAVLHANGARLIFRVVREDGSPAPPGEAGRLVLTDLGNWVMPFLNYDIGDRAALGGRCPCGRGLPTLVSLEGRSTELIRTPAGKVVSAATLQGFRRTVPGALDCIWEYQAVQTAADAVVLRIVPTVRFTPAFARAVEEELEAFLGPGMDVRVEAVDRIALEPSGKRLIIKSELTSA
jgi:phenylacetate-CoA ligase